MSLDLTLLTKYTDQLSAKIVKDTILSSPVVDLVDVVEGYGDSMQLVNMSTTIYGTNGVCADPVYSGSTQLVPRILQFRTINFSDTICVDDLQQYFTSVDMKKGSNNNDTWTGQAAEEFTSLTTDTIKKTIGLIAWNGDEVTGTAGTTKLANGFLQILTKTSASASTVNLRTLVAATQYSALTIANTIGFFDNYVMPQIAALPIIGAENLVAFVGYDMFTNIATAQRLQNLYHVAPEVGKNYMMQYANTNLTIIGDPALNGSGKIVISTLDNFVVGAKLKSEIYNAEFKWIYDAKYDKLIWRFKAGIGFQIRRPSNVLIY